MKEKTLIKISLICIFIGIPVLFFLSQNAEVNDYSIEKITSDNIGRTTKTTGIVEAVNNNDKITRIKIRQNDLVEVIVFDNVELEEGQKVEIMGRIDEYNGKQQIIGEEIKTR